MSQITNPTTGTASQVSEQSLAALPDLAEAVRSMVAEVRMLRMETAALRMGMIDAGTAKEINPNDVRTVLAAA